MTREKARGLLDIAKDQVPFGIYALEKKGCIELRRDRPESRTKLKELKRQYKAAGFKVYANGI